MDVKTNVGKTFLALITKHFPAGNRLHKVINRNKVKISYCCLPNMGNIIAKNNAKILKKQSPPQTKKLSHATATIKTAAPSQEDAG